MKNASIILVCSLGKFLIYVHSPHKYWHVDQKCFLFTVRQHFFLQMLCFFLDLAQAVVDAGAVPLLVLCIQEPEIALKRIAASALSDIAKHSPEVRING